MTAAVTEEWRDVVGYEGLYKVSDHGRVRRDGRILKPILGNHGYHYNTVSKDGVVTKIDIHRLVAFVFIPNPESKPCVDHIDGNPLNNHASNLRWVTQSENQWNRKSKAKHKGVSWDLHRHKWRTQIAIKKNRIHLGYFDNPDEAYWIYCAAAVFYHGEFACG
jgi:hypothetical protein